MSMNRYIELHEIQADILGQAGQSLARQSRIREYMLLNLSYHFTQLRPVLIDLLPSLLAEQFFGLFSTDADVELLSLVAYHLFHLINYG
jgi:hypothetical protein